LLTNGSRLGPHEIIIPLGEGGMGEVCFALPPAKNGRPAGI